MILLGGSEWRERWRPTRGCTDKEMSRLSFLGSLNPHRGAAGHCRVLLAGTSLRSSHLLLWPKGNQDPETNRSLLDTKQPRRVQYSSSGQAEDPRARIKALVTDSMDISPPAPWGSLPTSFLPPPLPPPQVPCAPPLPLLGKDGDRSIGAGFEGRWSGWSTGLEGDTQEGSWGLDTTEEELGKDRRARASGGRQGVAESGEANGSDVR